MKKEYREFYSRIKREIFNCSAVRKYHNNIWDADFNFDVKYYKSFPLILFHYLKNYSKFKKLYDTNKCAQVYNMLCDEYSKDIYLKVLAYRVFYDTRVNYPLMYDKGLNEFWFKYDYLLTDDTAIEVTNGVLRKYDLHPINKDLKIIYGNKLAFYICFLLEQYNYKNKILPQEGDIVIDGGGCYGETALMFADKMHGKGKVYSFEFVEKNLDIFRQNLELNPQYKDMIEIVESPITDKSETYYADYQASMSHIHKEKELNYQKVQSITIDEFVEKYNVSRIDFIKFDIEYFEQQGLRGAINTIKQFHPKLAICIYHTAEDLYQIPLMIKEMVPEYKFYVDHFTINLEETVLYGICNND